MSEQMMLAVMQSESIVELSLVQLVLSKTSPFRLYSGKQLKALIDSIQENGISTPLIVREWKNSYEILSGANRYNAAKSSGMKTVPAVIRLLDNAAAMKTILDSNVQREKFLPSERAKSYLMQTQLCPTDTITALISKNKTNKKQWYRCLRLNELMPKLLDAVDDGRLPFRSALELSYLPQEKQRIICRKISKGIRITIQQAILLREQGETLTKETVNQILFVKPDRRITIAYSEVADYLSDYGRAKEEIIQALKWRAEHEKQRHI